MRQYTRMVALLVMVPRTSYPYAAKMFSLLDELFEMVATASRADHLEWGGRRPETS